ncbi:MAG TPA: hypothetical protein VG672_04505 [Bryobacteraceae bacterium]|nr:hypothetical protein [Bryobacteraceae bacterium]HWB95933.1 hypothetical protein [Bryobacteraceae bacterium]
MPETVAHPQIDEDPELDPNNGETELDKLRGQTTLHAKPARLEDEGQSGG